MRLSYFELKSILDTFYKVFKKGKIYLFGSRLDDAKKGGDIDLFLDVENRENLFDQKMAFLVALERKIGEQKIDIVFAKDRTRPIEQQARNEGVELTMNTLKLEKYFNECDKHIQRINEAYSDIQNIMPLDVNKYTNLDKHSVQAIDQYLFRFSKLQDTMGDKIFTALLALYEEDSPSKPFIDVLNRLEKLGYIVSAKEWITLRKIRNNISHQYDDEPEEMSQAINSIVTNKDVIIKIYTLLKDKYLNESL